jgi:homoserine kinase
MNSPSKSMAVRVPASSANLGPGFDVLGMAVSLHIEAGFGNAPAESNEADEKHPLTIAYRHAGGKRELWVRSQIPMGKGLGFSGAARVAGCALAHAEKHGTDQRIFDAAKPEILRQAAELEGHPDNAGASLYGGVVASVDNIAVRVPTPLDPAVIVWVPEQQTSTKESRTKLPVSVSFADAIFNVGNTALRWRWPRGTDCIKTCALPKCPSRKTPCERRSARGHGAVGCRVRARRWRC